MCFSWNRVEPALFNLLKLEPNRSSIASLAHKPTPTWILKRIAQMAHYLTSRQLDQKQNKNLGLNIIHYSTSTTRGPLVIPII